MAFFSKVYQWMLSLPVFQYSKRKSRRNPIFAGLSGKKTKTMLYSFKKLKNRRYGEIGRHTSLRGLRTLCPFRFESG
jgi:hypothetical protein